MVTSTNEEYGPPSPVLEHDRRRRNGADLRLKLDILELSGRINNAFESSPRNGNVPATPPTSLAEYQVEREQWSNPIEFFLSCVAMSVGLGNVWRFPYQAFKNGGGAFLIPYLIVLALIGRPIYFLELAIGQFSNYGQTKVWNISPVFKGVGWGSLYGTVCVVSCYACVMALTVFYFFASMTGTLPWINCNQDTISLYNSTYFCRPDSPGFVYEKLPNGSARLSNTSVSQVYFEHRVLRQNTSIDDGIGFPLWDLSLCLVFSWLCIWGSLVRGVSSAGKVAYFTALFPYVVLFVMLIRGVTLEGAGVGILYFVKPQWDMMLKPDVWYAAVNQCFFSLSTGFGSVIMFSSYNRFGHNIYRDAWILSLLDTFTSVLAGLAIFSILGHLAYTLNVEVPDVARGGPGLTFITFAQALGTFPASQLFSILFYLMLFTLGAGSATSWCSGIVTSICDQMPNWRKPLVTTVFCICGFCIGLVFVTPGGQFISELVLHFGTDFVIYVMAILEVGAIAYVYGLKNFLNDIEFMLGIKLGFYWKFCWAVATPIGLSTILVYALVTKEDFTFGGLPYPKIVYAFGWLIAAVALLIIPAMAIHTISRQEGQTLWEKLKMSFKPTTAWVPRSVKRRREWELFKAAKAHN